MISAILSVLLCLTVGVTVAAPIDARTYVPVNATKNMPLLTSTLDAKWPTLVGRSVLAAQIEQETCNGLTHSKCWTSKAELKTPREYGFGWGQITVTERYNNFEAVKQMDPALKAWKWEDRLEEKSGMIAYVAFMRNTYSQVKWVKEEEQRLAFALSGYNGGMGSVLKDRKLCSATPNCNQNIWFGNVENTSWKSKIKVKGYGKSFYDINRDYVRNGMVVRRDKYRKFFDGK